MQTRHYVVTVFSTLMAVLATASFSYAQGPAFAGIFGSRDLEIENPNAPGTNYEMILHVNEPAAYDDLEYDPGRGYGFVVIDEENEDRNTSARFGPFDDSPNNRGNFDPVDDLYNSFIGFKSHPESCDEGLIGDRTSPCSTEIEPSGGIFRVDVPNGKYRFVGAFGDSDHPHAHRVLAENGGEGGPDEISDDFVTLVGNHDQAAWFQGNGDGAGDNPRYGSGVFARVGFDDKLPPAPQGDAEGSFPTFVDYDELGNPLTECTSPVDPDDEFEFLWKEETVVRHNGDEYSIPDVTCTTKPPSSPTLEVTNGYIRFHLLQGNSNVSEVEESGDGTFFTPEGPEVELARDPNGTDIVLLEVWPVGGDRVDGDYNGDEVLDAADMDLQSAEMKKDQAEQDLALYDHNTDGRVNEADRTIWVKSFRKTWVGDSNFDDEFNSGDLVAVFAAGKYETKEMAGWAQGDWTGDMLFDSGDLVAAFADGGYEQGPFGAAAVPEPSSLVLALLSVMGLVGIVRRRNG